MNSKNKLCPIVFLTIFSLAYVSGYSVVSSGFINGAGGDWHNAGNWDSGVPDAVDDQAFMLANPGGSVTVTGTSATIGLLQSNSDTDYVISTPLIFSTSAGSPVIQMGNSNAGALTLSGGITLVSDLAITIARATPGDLTISGDISGTGGLSCSGVNTGQLFLLGNNTYSGLTTVSQKTLNVNSVNSVPAASTLVLQNSGVVKASAPLTIAASVFCDNNNPVIDNNGNAVTITGEMGGSSIVIQGAGSVTITGNTNVLPFTVNSGTLALSTSGNMSTSVVSLQNSSIFDVTAVTGGTATIQGLNGTGSTSVNITGKNLTLLTSGTNNTFSGVISGVGGSLSVTNGGSLVLGGTNTYDGPTSVSSSATLGISSATNISSSSSIDISDATFECTGTFSLPHTITISSGAGTFSVPSGVVTINNSIGGNGSTFDKEGNGTLVLSGTIPATTGNTIINGGTLRANAVNIFPSGQTLSMTGTLDLNNLNQNVGTLSSSGGSAQILLGSAVMTVDQATSQSFDGVISGATGSVVKNLAGTLTLTGANTYGGGTTINAGTLTAGANGTMPSGGDVIVSGTFDVNSTTQSIGNFSGSGNTTLGSGSLTTTVTAPSTYSGIISGSGGSLTKAGASTLVLSGANTYSGGTTISAGTLQTGMNNVMPSGGAVAVTGTFALNGTQQSIGNLTGAGSITLGNGTLTVTPTSSSTYSGTIADAGGSLVKAGSSTLILSGNNTYGSGTSITGGILSISGSSNVGLGAVSIGAAGTLQGTGATYTLTNDIFVASGSTIDVTATQMTAAGMIIGVGIGGSLNKTGAGTLVISGANTYDGGTIIGAGTLQAGANNAIPAGSDVSVAGIFDVDTTTQSIANLTGAGATNIAATGLLTVTPPTDLTYPGTFTGAGDISKQGASQLQLTGNSTGFTGLCTVAAGELKLNGALGSGGSGAVTVSSGALFSGNATVGGTLTSHGTVSPGNSVGTMTVGSLVLGADSLLDIDINDALQSDVFTVSPGTATINGALNVNFLPGVYTAGLSYTIVNAAAGVSGTFASVTDNSPDFNIETTYTGTMVTLTIISPGSSLFFNLPLTGNAKSVADNINAISAAGTLTTDPDLNNAVEVLVGQSVDVISDALQRLDPTPYTTIGATTALVSPMLAEFFAGKKRKSCCPSQTGCENGKWSIWADPFVMHFDQGSRGSQDGFDALAGGFALGAERGLTNEWKVGVGFAYDHLSIDFDKHRGSSECNDSYLALFADGEGEQWHFACAMLGGVDAISNKRKIQYLSINSTARSDYCAGELIGQASGAYFLGPKARQFQFYGTITSDTLFEPAIHEHGAGGLNLKIRGNTASVLVSQAGVLFKQRKEFATGCWGPDLWVGYVNEAYLTNGKLRSNFVNQVIPFTTVGVHKTQNLVEAGLSMTVLLNRGLSFIGTYSAQIGGKLVTQNGDLRFRWMF